MTKFEQMGVDFQKEAGSKSEAAYRIGVSCDICSKRGIIINGSCSSCPIMATHLMVMEAFSFCEEWDAKKEAAATEERKSKGVRM